MRCIEFTEEEIMQLAHGSICHEHLIVRRRMQSLLLKSQGLLHQEIVKILGISSSMLRSYFDLFLEGRVEAPERLGYKGEGTLLMKKDEIIVNQEANPPATYKEAQAKIQVVTG